LSTITPKETALRETLFLALHRAGHLIEQNLLRNKKTRFKGCSSINLLTWVDNAADRLIIRTIRERFSEHDFLTEESTPTHRQSAYKWIIDPLDGTTNYAHEFPQVGVSIGLEREGAIMLAGVYDPFRHELFWAEKGHGAFLKQGNSPSKRIRVSRTPRLQESLLLTGFPYDRHERADFYLGYVRAFMARIQGIRRMGAAALDLCWVACGRVDGYWEWRLKPWDTAAGGLIVQEAGGELSDFKGKPFSVYGEQTLATNGKIHREMLRVMRTVRPLGYRGRS
jgi:myo-inositol-1(or 4)-monophosphatase